MKSDYRVYLIHLGILLGEEVDRRNFRGHFGLKLWGGGGGSFPAAPRWACARMRTRC